MTVTSLPTGRPRDLELHRDRLDRLRKLVAASLEHLDDVRAQTATLRAATYDDTRSARSVPNPTLGTVIALDACDTLRADILELIPVIGKAITLTEEACTAALRYHGAGEDRNDTESPSEARCIGDGTPRGATCHQIPADRPDGHGGRLDDQRCIDCGRRYDQTLEDAKAEREAARAAKAMYMRQYRRGVAS